MLAELLKAHIASSSNITGLLAKYNKAPAVFYQKSPQDTDKGWRGSCFPRMDFNIDMRYDPERRTAGALIFNVWCCAESGYMPEDIESPLIELISGTFYTGQEATTICAAWNRSDAFTQESTANAGSNTTPEVFGVSLTFDLMEFPAQITSSPDPVLGLNLWTKAQFPGVAVIAHDVMPPVWKPTDENPAVYWRFEGMESSDRQSYSVNWYNGRFAAHIMAESVPARNQWTRTLVEKIQYSGEIVLVDGSPMFATQIAVRHSADPLREGQLMLNGRYGVLTRR